ncbi:MAG TPA: hypothetical protein VI365_04295 [Trebonia sp.]
MGSRHQGSAAARRPAPRGHPREPAMFLIGLIIVVLILATLLLRRRGRRRR